MKDVHLRVLLVSVQNYCCYQRSLGNNTPANPHTLSRIISFAGESFLSPSLLISFLLLKLNPSQPYIGIHIFHTVLHTFPKVLTGRICWTVKSFLVGDHFLYSHDLNVWFRGVIERRNLMLVTLRVKGLKKNHIFQKINGVKRLIPVQEEKSFGIWLSFPKTPFQCYSTAKERGSLRSLPNVF